MTRENYEQFKENVKLLKWYGFVEDEYEDEVDEAEEGSEEAFREVCI